MKPRELTLYTFYISGFVFRYLFIFLCWPLILISRLPSLTLPILPFSPVRVRVCFCTLCHSQSLWHLPLLISAPLFINSESPHWWKTHSTVLIIGQCWNSCCAKKWKLDFSFSNRQFLPTTLLRCWPVSDTSLHKIPHCFVAKVACEGRCFREDWAENAAYRSTNDFAEK